MAFVTADLDGDGFDDFVTTNSQSACLSLSLNQLEQILGDINGDGNVNLIDVEPSSRYLLQDVSKQPQILTVMVLSICSMSGLIYWLAVESRTGRVWSGNTRHPFNIRTHIRFKGDVLNCPRLLRSLFPEIDLWTTCSRCAIA